MRSHRLEAIFAMAVVALMWMSTARAEEPGEADPYDTDAAVSFSAEGSFQADFREEMLDLRWLGGSRGGSVKADTRCRVTSASPQA